MNNRQYRNERSIAGQPGPFCMYLAYNGVKCNDENWLSGNRKSSHFQISINWPFDSVSLVRIILIIKYHSGMRRKRLYPFHIVQVWWMKKILRLNVSPWKLHRHEHDCSHKIYKWKLNVRHRWWCVCLYVFGFNLFTVSDTTKSILWVSVSMPFPSC